LLPYFARSCRDSADVVIIHQDSFAADYQDEEYTLFGKAMKFAGIYGKEIRVIGKNRDAQHGENRIPTIGPSAGVEANTTPYIDTVR